jgi:hypothetical protein
MIATYVVSNTFAITIQSIEHGIEDHVVFNYNNEGRLIKKVIKHDGDRAYFNWNGSRIYLDECIRV